MKAVNDGGGTSIAIIESALSSANAKFVILAATVGQLFCGMACVTSASRMCYAFSRDRAVPGHKHWAKLNHHRVPYGSVILMCVLALIITLPALKGAGAFPWAFFAVVLIATIALYIAYVMPTYLRWRMGDRFVPGPWTLGKKYKWVNLGAIIWVAICVVCFCLPFTPAGSPAPGRRRPADPFKWEAVNYAPLVLRDRRAHRHLVEAVGEQVVPGPDPRGRGARRHRTHTRDGRPDSRRLASAGCSVR